jgi:hypothetical protein
VQAFYFCDASWEIEMYPPLEVVYVPLLEITKNTIHV